VDGEGLLDGGWAGEADGGVDGEVDAYGVDGSVEADLDAGLSRKMGSTFRTHVPAEQVAVGFVI
jgi:hypothetical protein